MSVIASESRFAIGAGALPFSGVLKSSGAATADAQYGPCGNSGASGMHLIIDVTAVTDTPSVVFTIQGYDPASATWYPVLISSAITAIGTTVLKLGPALTPVANLAASDYVPATWLVDANHADADSIAFSLGVVLFR